MADLKYDYNKDGEVTAADVNMASQEQFNTTTGNWWGNVLGNAGAGLLTGGAVGAGIGAFGAGIGALPGAIIGGATGATAGAMTGISSANAIAADNDAKLTDILKSYGYNDAEIEAHKKSIQLMQNLDSKTGGKISEINNKAKLIQDNANVLNLIKSGVINPDENARDLAGSAGSAGAASSLALNAVIAPAANKIMGKNTKESEQLLLDEIKKTADELGIDVSSIAYDKNMKINMEKKLDAYKTEYGLYQFPKASVNTDELGTEDKKLLSQAYNAIKGKVLNNALNSPESRAAEGSALEAQPLDANAPVSPMVPATVQTIDNGDGTTTTTTPNADGTAVAVTKDESGAVVSTENITSSEYSASSQFGMTANGTANLPTDYIGLTDPKTNVTYKTDANGNRVQTEAIYTYSSADSYFNGLNEQQIKDAKKKLYAAGYYGASDIVSVLQGSVSDADKKAVIKAMGDSNLNGLEINDYLQPKYETYLLTGRPVGEKAVDLNGDGTADATVTTALQSFFDRNGLQVSDNYIKSYETAIKSGSTTLEDVMKQVREKMVSSAYPAWKDEILGGKDIADIASPYIQSMKSTLGLVDVDMNDPLLQNALSKSGPDGKPVYTSLFDFKQQMRKDQRWENTDEAQKEYADTALTVLKTFGIIG